MKKFLLAVVAVTLFAGAGRAEVVAGQEGVVPVLPVIVELPPPPRVASAAPEVAAQTEFGPDTVWRAVRDARRVVLHIKGRMLGSRIQNGMTTKQVEQIMGCERSKTSGDPRGCDTLYLDLGLWVSFRREVAAAGEFFYVVASVDYCQLLE